MNLIDFDGTIIDLWPRYCAVFNYLLKSNIELSEYKTAKQKLQRDSLVADYFGLTLSEDYFSMKAIALEDPIFLELDILLFDSIVLNKVLSKNFCILSHRRNPESFYLELSRLNIKCDAVVVNSKSKKQWAIDSGAHIDRIIGDSIQDLEVGSIPGVEAWMTGYGLGTREQFDSANIIYRYVENAQNLMELLQQI